LRVSQTVRSADNRYAEENFSMASRSEETRQRAQMHFEKKEQRKVEATNSRNAYHAQIDADAAKTARLRALRLAKEAADELATKTRLSEKALSASPKATRKKPSRKASPTAES
jgi:hypothetical protein